MPPMPMPMQWWQKITGRRQKLHHAVPSDAAIRACLDKISEPQSGKGLVDSGMLQGFSVVDGKVFITLQADKSIAARAEPLRQAAEMAVSRLDGVASAVAVFTAEARSPANPESANPESANPESANPESASPESASAGSAGQASPVGVGIGAVKHIIAVASGKGGVGKSTIAANLALALQSNGYRSGLLDADIYGPSQPLLMGVNDKPTSDGKAIEPLRAHGIPLMSIGFMVQQDTPMIWRGPMVQSALMQLLEKVVWGALDILVVDMPPGTGDAQLTLSQQVRLAGAVIVSTPQDLALLDAVKAVRMFEKVRVPILGLVENMSYFTCPHCGKRSDIFSHAGAQKRAKELHIDYLGTVPLATEIREHSDSGLPIVMGAKDNVYRPLFLQIAAQITAKLDSSGGSPKTPEIIA